MAREFADPAVTPHGAPAAPNPPRPLEGLRVVAFVAFWAGPFVASYLAAMGADVVKVESIQRPDGMRFAGGVKIGDPQIFEWSAVTHGANVGLRDVTLDLSRPEGADLARRLVAGRRHRRWTTSRRACSTVSGSSEQICARPSRTSSSCACRPSASTARGATAAASP